MSVLLSDPIRLQKMYISGWPSHCLTNTHQNWDAFGDRPFCSLSSKCTVQKDGRLVKGPSTSASSRRLSSSLSLIRHPPCQPAVAPIPPKNKNASSGTITKKPMTTSRASLLSSRPYERKRGRSGCHGTITKKPMTTSRASSLSSRPYKRKRGRSGCHQFRNTLSPLGYLITLQAM